MKIEVEEVLISMGKRRIHISTNDVFSTTLNKNQLINFRKDIQGTINHMGGKELEKRIDNHIENFINS